jgi:hypothetical protein
MTTPTAAVLLKLLGYFTRSALYTMLLVMVEPVPFRVWS